MHLQVNFLINEVFIRQLNKIYVLIEGLFSAVEQKYTPIPSNKQLSFVVLYSKFFLDQLRMIYKNIILIYLKSKRKSFNKLYL